MSLVSYAGATKRSSPKSTARPAARPNPAEIEPIGMAGVALLRRVKAAPEGYRVFRRSDRMIFGRALMAGLIESKPRHHDTVRLTAAGAAFLDRLARVE